MVPSVYVEVRGEFFWASLSGALRWEYSEFRLSTLQSSWPIALSYRCSSIVRYGKAIDLHRMGNIRSFSEQPGICKEVRQSSECWLTSPRVAARHEDIQMFESLKKKVLVPHRDIVAKELAGLLAVLAHPQRIRIIEELRRGERDVTSIQATLEISISGVSQHLMLLRAHRLVSDRREGRQVFYSLRQPNLARWLTDAMQFVGLESVEADQLRKAIKKTRADWVTP